MILIGDKEQQIGCPVVINSTKSINLLPNMPGEGGTSL